MTRLFPLLSFLLFSFIGNAQVLQSLQNGPAASFRGLSVVNDTVAWVSGSKGTVGRTTDGGKIWTWTTVAGHEKNDFRAIISFDANTAVIMSVASPGYILKTIDGGVGWKEVYKDTAKQVFMDAMDLSGEGALVVVGDPLDGKAYAYGSEDRGNTWTQVEDNIRPDLLPGEAFFASSSTNLKVVWMNYRLVTGGEHARFLSTDGATTLPLVQGRQSTGANSVAVNIDKEGNEKIMVVGGDFAADTVSMGNSAYSTDGGKAWKVPETPPHGYRSCVEFIDDHRLIACGTSGVDVSEDGGVHWRLISKDSYHVVRKAKDGKAVYLAGGGGRLAKLAW
jgi:photosystem II stability/assembly factor-like uncharacterized protein